MNVARNIARNGLNISGHVDPTRIPKDINESLKRPTAHHFIVNDLKIFMKRIWMRTELTRPATRRPLIVSSADGKLRLCLVPMNFVQVLGAILMFPDQVGANCNFFF